MTRVTIEILQSFAAFNDVPAEQLDWFLSRCSNRIILGGNLLFKPGMPIDFTYVFISGKLSLYVLNNGEAREFACAETGSVHGYLPFSRGKVNFAYGRALENTQILLFPANMMTEMICTQFELTQALVHVMSSRVRNITARQQQDEKMAALGRLHAGLAHELNNPVAAILRAVAILQRQLQHMRQAFEEVAAERLSDGFDGFVNSLILRAIAHRQQLPFSMQEKSLREARLVYWLERRHIQNASDTADDFAGFGFTEEDADRFLAYLPGQWASSGINWLDSHLVAETLLKDIEEASGQIDALLKSVKAFIHADQSHDRRFADIHEGLRHTLVTLKYRLEDKNVQVIQHFDTEIPFVKIMIGELNQVWSNLIDNAIDAMENTQIPVLELNTRSDGKFVYVSIGDNGMGIPACIADRVFDPFFSTKPISKGTGLGLDIVSRIVKLHDGTVTLQSVPGRTEFIVCIPINS